MDRGALIAEHESEVRLKVLTRLALDAVITINAQGRITDWNPQAESTFGWSCEEAVGQLLSEMIIPSRYREAHERGLRNFLQTGEGPILNKRLEIEALNRAGHEFPVELAISAFHSGPGWEFVAFVRETTPRKRIEEALAEETELLYLLMDNTQDSIYFKDTAGRFTRINRAHARTLGVADPRKALGKTDFDFLNFEYAQEAFADEQRIMQTGIPAVGKMENLRWKDGRTTWYSTTKVLLHDSQRRVAGTLTVARDMTEIKRAEAELQAAKATAEAASRAKSEFLANMSHEIRTPMNGILGMTELTLDTELTSEQREFLQMVKSSADSLLTLINDILDFSKIEAGKLELDPIEFNLRDSMDETMKLLAVHAHRKGLELINDIDPAVPDVLIGDVTRIRQIVINLMGNAVKFTDRGEVVLRVETESRDNDSVALHFSVTDSGIGIAAEKQRLIFDAFSQADASTTRKYGGTGLGLTICARLVTMMNGRIWVESEAGQGSIFHFTARLGVARRSIEAVSSQSISLEGVSVLVVDDNLTNRRILDRMLAHWGMKPTVTDGVQAALAALERYRLAGHAFSLILTDAHMPEHDGFEMAEIMRQSGISDSMVIMLTSGGQRGDAARCREVGIAAYLTKPVRQQELRETIVRVLAANSQAADTPKLLTRHSLREEHEAEVVSSRTALRILVAEDNPVNQRVAQRLLNKRGHAVVLAGNGHEVLSALEKERFDLVLMDVQMPEMDGFEATAVIRARERSKGTAHIPIVAMTARALKEDEQRCLEAGMDGYLCKPIRIQDLAEVLDKYAVSSGSARTVQQRV